MSTSSLHTDITQYPCASEDPNNLWEFSFSGYWTIVSPISGLPLEVPGWATADGTLIDQNNMTETTNQLWIFLSLGASSTPRNIYIYIYIYISDGDDGDGESALDPPLARYARRLRRVGLGLRAFSSSSLVWWGPVPCELTGFSPRIDGIFPAGTLKQYLRSWSLV